MNQVARQMLDPSLSDSPLRQQQPSCSFCYFIIAALGCRRLSVVVNRPVGAHLWHHPAAARLTACNYQLQAIDVWTFRSYPLLTTLFPTVARFSSASRPFLFLSLQPPVLKF